MQRFAVDSEPPRRFTFIAARFGESCQDNVLLDFGQRLGAGRGAARRMGFTVLALLAGLGTLFFVLAKKPV